MTKVRQYGMERGFITEKNIEKRRRDDSEMVFFFIIRSTFRLFTLHRAGSFALTSINQNNINIQKYEKHIVKN